MHLDKMRDASRELVIDARPAAITTARIWHCKYRTLEPLAACTNLTALVVATYPDDDLRVLARLTELRYLRLLHLPRVKDLGPISALHNIVTLSLATAAEWDEKGRVQTVNSLQPIASLGSLKHLELFGVVNGTRSLHPLLGMRGLVSARFSGYPKSETRAFYTETGCLDAFNPEPDFA